MKIRKLTLADFGILEKVGSPLISGENKPMQSVIDFAYLTTRPVDEALEAMDNWDKVVLKYASEIGVEEMEQFTEEMTKSFNEIYSAQFEVEESDGKKT